MEVYSSISFYFSLYAVCKGTTDLQYLCMHKSGEGDWYSKVGMAWCIRRPFDLGLALQIDVSCVHLTSPTASQGGSTGETPNPITQP